MKYSEVIDMLGREGKDKITGVKGIISSISFDLYGCIQVVLTPSKVKENSEIVFAGWFDINRIELTKKKRTMVPPSYETKYSSSKDVHGPAAKPSPR